MTHEQLSRLFGRILTATLANSVLLGASGCSATVGPADGDPPTDVVRTDAVGRPDVVDPPDRVDPRDVVNPPDVVDPVDVPDVNCPPRTLNVDTCSATVVYPCNPPAGVVVGQPVTSEVCAANCPPGMFGTGRAFACFVSRDASGGTALSCTYCAVGRRLEGLADIEPIACDEAVGRFLASNATLEAASVTAFERLAESLAHHDAPAWLLARIDAAADEERDHARRVADAARTWGATPAEPVIDDASFRSLHAIALENVTEGCVRETFGAVVAHWQAEHAADESLRVLFARLAADETRHAALSWDLHRWISARLGNDERASLEAARARAIDDLIAEVDRGVDAEVISVAGVPDTRRARTMLATLRTELWS